MGKNEHRRNISLSCIVTPHYREGNHVTSQISEGFIIPGKGEWIYVLKSSFGIAPRSGAWDMGLLPPPLLGNGRKS